MAALSTKRDVDPGDALAMLRRGWGLDGAVSRLGAGLINDTFAVEVEAARFVLQRVHPVFGPAVHTDIWALTEHLETRGVATPRLIVTHQGDPYLEHRGEVWRLMTRLPGVSFDTIASLEQAGAAGQALGRFHKALADLDHTFVGQRSGVHDTSAHLCHLERSLRVHAHHRLASEVTPIGHAILAAARNLPALAPDPLRVVHGDPKLNNLLFEGDSGPASQRAIGWIDLDTVGPMVLAYELGDAWRSWCNPQGESDDAASFDLAIFEASLAGWLKCGPFTLQPGEPEGLVIGVEWITLELAARFAADAVCEAYFGYDRGRYTTSGDHNLVRAAGQWTLHHAVVACRAERASIVDRLLTVHR